MRTSSPLLQEAAMARTVDPLRLAAGGSVVLLVPHPDDETLGCGLAIAALADAGVPVQCVLITDGRRSHSGSLRFPQERLVRLREREFSAALFRLSTARHPNPLMLRYPDCETPDDPVARQRICDRISTFIGPQTGAIWACWAGDPHIDHVRTARIAADLHARFTWLAWYSYPIWGRFGPAGPVPQADNILLVKEPHLMARKRHALAAYASQMTPMIDDDPEGYVMRGDHQRHFLHHPEIFIDETQGNR